MKLKNLLIGAGVAAVGGIGVKLAVDYLRNRGKEETPAGSLDDEAAVEQSVAAKMASFSAPPEQIIQYVNVEPSSVQNFLDTSFGSPGRYVPNRPPKVFDYQGTQYMVIWADDKQKNKKQMLAFKYTDAGRKMVASVGYTADATDYNISLEDTPMAVELASTGQQITSGQGQTSGTNEVDFVIAGS